MDILLIDDDAIPYVKALQAATENHPKFQHISWHTAPTGVAGIEAIRERSYDLILMDGHLRTVPYDFGPTIVMVIRAGGYTAPICMFSQDEDVNRHGISVGANFSINKRLLLATSDSESLWKHHAFVSLILSKLSEESNLSA